MPKIKIQKNPDKPESTLVLAEAIIKISDGFNSLKLSGLNEEAIIVLIQHKTKLAQKDIKLVLNSLKQLKAWYCKH